LEKVGQRKNITNLKFLLPTLEAHTLDSHTLEEREEREEGVARVLFRGEGVVILCVLFKEGGGSKKKRGGGLLDYPSYIAGNIKGALLGTHMQPSPNPTSGQFAPRV
jgi:hypothetical protein